MRNITLAIFVLAAIFACTFADDDYWPCHSDNDCEYDDCCATVPGGTEKFCKDKPDDRGQPCGGPYLCGSCGDGLQCIPSAPGSPPVGYYSATGRCGGRLGPFDRFFDK